MGLECGESSEAWSIGGNWRVPDLIRSYCVAQGVCRDDAGRNRLQETWRRWDWLDREGEGCDDEVCEVVMK